VREVTIRSEQGMDASSLTGLLLGTGLIIGSITLGGATAGSWWSGLCVTIGGILAALLVQFSWSQLVEFARLLKDGFLSPLPSRADLIGRFKSLATFARQEGLLALETHGSAERDPFLRRGLELVTDGGRDDLAAALEGELSLIETRYQSAGMILNAAASAATSFGMIASLVGVVNLLWTIDDPSLLGVGTARALLSTIAGTVVAHLVCLPLAGKLESRLEEELVVRRLTIDGLLGLADDITPRHIEERLLAFTPKVAGKTQVRAA
jgi:chemotaxis protein MotA